MSNFTVEGGIHAGRDNIINVGDKQVYKSLDQCTPNELRQEDQHIREVNRSYRNDQIKKSKLWFVLLMLGLAGVGTIALFAREVFINYTGGNKPNLQILLRFVWDAVGNEQDPKLILLKIAGFIFFVLLTVLLPFGSILQLWFYDDAFLKKQKGKRRWIKDRIIELGEKP